MNLIGTPPRTIKTTQMEFDKLKATMKKDPEAFAQAINAGNQASAQAGGEKMDNIRVMKGPGPRGPVINNPIELPGKQ